MAYDLHIAGPALQTVLDLRGDCAALAGAPLPPWPARPNTRTQADGLSLLWVGPGRWLLVGPLAQEDALEAALRPLADPLRASVTPVSDAFAFFTLTGADAGAAMAIACPLDLHPAAFATDRASFSEAFGVRALVMPAGPGWTLGVASSDAAYVGACLRRIG